VTCEPPNSPMNLPVAYAPASDAPAVMPIRDSCDGGVLMAVEIRGNLA